MSYLKDNAGNDSSTRLIFVIGSIWNMALTTMLALKEVDIPVLIAFFSAIEGVLIGLKLGGKQLEKTDKI